MNYTTIAVDACDNHAFYSVANCAKLRSMAEKKARVDVAFFAVFTGIYMRILFFIFSSQLCKDVHNSAILVKFLRLPSANETYILIIFLLYTSRFTSRQTTTSVIVDSVVHPIFLCTCAHSYRTLDGWMDGWLISMA